MGENPEVALPLAARIGLAPECAPESPLVPGEGGLGLPPLAVHPLVPTAPRFRPEPLDHLTPVAGLRPRPALTASVQRDDGGPHPEVLTGVPVVLLGIERGVGQDAVPGDDPGRLGQDGGELRGIVGRAGRDPRPGDEVARGIDRDGPFGPQPGRVFAAGPLEEGPGGVAALQSGAVHGGGGRVPEQPAVGCGRGDAEEEGDGLPVFSSRPAA